MAIPVIQSVATTINNALTNTSYVLNAPAGIQVGDLLVAFLTLENSVDALYASNPIVPPSGWVIVRPLGGVGTLWPTVWWKIADASDTTAPSFTFTGQAASYNAGVLRITGHYAADPIRENEYGYDTSFEETQHFFGEVGSAITTTANDNLLLTYFSDYNPDTTHTRTGTGFTQVYSNGTTGDRSFTAVHSTPQATAGSWGGDAGGEYIATPDLATSSAQYVIPIASGEAVAPPTGDKVRLKRRKTFLAPPSAPYQQPRKPWPNRLREAAPTTVTKSVSDTLDVSLDEVATAAIPITAINVTDILDVSLAEVSSVAFYDAAATPITADDTLDVSSVEAVLTMRVGLPTSDTLAVESTTASALLVSNLANDTVSISLSETKALTLGIFGGDNLDFAVADLGSTAVAIATGDSVSFATSEATGHFLKQNRPDSQDIAITEAFALRAAMPASDQLRLSLTDSESVASLLDASDTLAVSVSDIARAVTLVTTSDAFDLTIDESYVLLVPRAASDAWDVAVDSSLSLGASRFVSDVLTIRLLEGESVAVRLAPSDVLDLNFTETAVVRIPFATSDALNVGAGDVAAILAKSQASDYLAVSQADASTTSVSLSRSDSASVRFAESGTSKVAFSTTDVLSIAIDEQATLGTVLSKTASDTLMVGITDAVLRISTRGDYLCGAISVLPRLAGRISSASLLTGKVTISPC